ncbi:MAG TPA: hypothetical protein VJ987_02360, partial [Anaerolineales bacterium]|nr:hypothetical protein [Anaerolineales bacterium]
MQRRRKKPQVETQDEYYSLVVTWVLRILLSSAAAFKGFFKEKCGYQDINLREFLLLPDDEVYILKLSQVREILRHL